MLEGDSGQEILSLLKQHNLIHEISLLNNNSSDVNSITQILINSYIKTKDHDFFGHFYNLTNLSLTNKASAILGRMRNQVSPEDIVADAFAIFLKLFYNNQLKDISHPYPYMNRVIKNLAYSSMLKQKKINERSLSSINNFEYFEPFDKITSKEENERRILHEDILRDLIVGRYKGLAENDIYVFKAYYAYNQSAKEIADNKSTSVYNIYKILYRIKRKVKKLIQYFGSLETGEDEV